MLRFEIRTFRIHGWIRCIDERIVVKFCERYIILNTNLSHFMYHVPCNLTYIIFKVKVGYTDATSS